MSRSYNKVIRCGVRYGSNTDYYRTKRRWFRHKAKQNLYIHCEEFVNPEQLKKFKDNYEEPTDGTFLVTKDNICEWGIGSKWYNKFMRLLKYNKRIKK